MIPYREKTRFGLKVGYVQNENKKTERYREIKRENKKKRGKMTETRNNVSFDGD